jgi:hypothetical protein
MLPEVDAMAGADVLAQLHHTLADRFAVAEQPGFQSPDPQSDPGLGLLVAQRLQPLRDRFPAIRRLVAKDVDHGNDCNLKVTAQTSPGTS